ncbi:MAG: hypothetical protein ACLPOO_11270 [Terriglobales bacterium]
MSNTQAKTNTNNVDNLKKPTVPTDSEFDEKVDQVYEKYGSDLDAFVRDVQKELQKKSEGSDKRAAASPVRGGFTLL